MKELRCLVFTDQEVASAIIDRKRKRRDPLPSGQIAGMTFRVENETVAVFHMVSDNGELADVVISEEETMAAMISFCMRRKIPLPVESDKFLYLINDNLTLMITIKFNKVPRLVTGGPAHQERDRKTAKCFN